MSAQNNKLLDLILAQLKELNEKTDKLTEDINDTSLELTKISGIKYTLADIKKWKENFEQTINLNDLKDIKETLEDYKKFKTRILTLLAAAGFVIGLLVSILEILHK